MDAPENRLSNLFPLESAPAVLEGFRPLQGPHDPAGDWTFDYDELTLIHRGHKTGRVRVARQALPEGCRLTVRHERPQAKTRRIETAVLVCRGDRLSTPVSWDLRVETLDRAGRAVQGTSLRQSGRVRGSAIELRDEAGRRRLDAPPAWTATWALFEAVTRLPREPFDPLQFALLDDFDEWKPGQTLSYRGWRDVKLGQRRVQQTRWVELERGRIRRTRWGWEGGTLVRLHAFQQLGRGVVPWVYWVDSQGRLLFVVAGLTAYVLRA